MSVKQIQKLIWQDKIDQALQEIENLPDKDRIDGLIYKSDILTKKRDIDHALSIVDEILLENEFSLNLLQKLGANVIKIQALMRGGRFIEAFEKIDVCDEILTQLNQTEREEVKEWEGKLLAVKAGFQMIGGKLEESMESFHQSIALLTDIQYYKEMYLNLNNLGWIYRAHGKLDRALDCFLKQLKVSQELKDKKLISWSKFNTAYIYFYKGDLNKAADYAHECLKIFQEIKHDNGLSHVFTVIGSIHRGKGELDKSLEYYNKVLEIYNSELNDQLPVPHSVCVGLRDLGIVYFHKNALEKSVDTFKKAIETHKTLCRFKSTIYDFELVVSYFWMISLYNESGYDGEVENLLSEINKVVKSWPMLKIFSKAGEALILKNKPRATDKIKAQQILNEILDVKFDYELEFVIQVNLCDLLLDELKFYGEEDVIQEIQSLITRISSTATNQRSITTLVTLYSLQAKLALVEGNIEYSNSILTQALSIANEKGLDFLSLKVKKQQDQLFNQLEEWKALLVQNSSIQERFEILDLKKYISTAINDVLANKFQYLKKKFELIYKDLLKEYPKIQKRQCRVGIAQIGVSQSGDLLSEFYNEKRPGFFHLKEEKVDIVLKKVKDMIEIASNNNVNILLFPELSIDLNYIQLSEALLQLAKDNQMYIIPGSYHNQDTNQNVSSVISPDGILWEQEKHIPATIHFGEKQIKESIDVNSSPRRTIVCNTEYGRLAIAICRDFLDLDLRVELKNFEPPVDLLFNLAFTPVTADFRAAHFDARRSIYAYCFFVNIAEFGDSLIYTPEKERTEQHISPKEEKLIYKDVDIFNLRAERKRWEIEHKKDRSFIQSTKY